MLPLSWLLPKVLFITNVVRPCADQDVLSNSTDLRFESKDEIRFYVAFSVMQGAAAQCKRVITRDGNAIVQLS